MHLFVAKFLTMQKGLFDNTVCIIDILVFFFK